MPPPHVSGGGFFIPHNDLVTLRLGTPGNLKRDVPGQGRAL
jgi:hypothetical protein